jgi:hypothetical protein
MNKLGYSYQYIEKNYVLMRKYYLMAIKKGNVDAMYNLGFYYGNEGKKISMKKYYLQAISNGSEPAMHCLNDYMDDSSSSTDLQNYNLAIIKGNIRFERVNLYKKNYTYGTLENRIFDLFCENIFNIKNNYLNIEDFNFCLLRIVDRSKNYSWYAHNESNSIKRFTIMASKLFYYNPNKNNMIKKEYKKNISKILKNNTSQIFMEYLTIHYYKYLEKIFSPGEKGYIKTKKHFESIKNVK